MKEFILCKITTIGNNSFLTATNEPAKLYEEMDEFFEERFTGFKKLTKVRIREYM